MPNIADCFEDHSEFLTADEKAEMISLADRPRISEDKKNELAVNLLKTWLVDVDAEIADILGQVEKQKPKVEIKVPKERKSKVAVLRGAIKRGGYVKFNRSIAERKLLPKSVQLMHRKGGIPEDTLIPELIAEGWLPQGTESLYDYLYQNPERLKEGPVYADAEAKTEAQKEIAKELEREYEPQEPPEGDYVTVKAEDLPDNATLTIIEGKTKDGWDRYKVDASDPFGITLEDGTDIELVPGDKVQVLKRDLPPKETLKLKREQAGRTAESRIEGKAVKKKDQIALFEADRKKKAQGLGLLDKEQRDLFSTTPGVPADIKELESKWKKQGVDLRLYETKQGDIKLDHIAVPKGDRKKGVGSSVMDDVTDFADRSGKRITLTVAVKDDSFGTTSRSRLIKYYKRFGFVQNKGRNKDFAISASMYRKPVEPTGYSTTPGGQKISIEDIKALYGSDKVRLMKDGSLLIIHPSSHNIRINLVDHIAPDETAFQIAYKRRMKPGETITGKYVDGEITLHRDKADIWTLKEEDFHHVDRMVLNARDRRILDKESGAENPNEEDRARVYLKYAQNVPEGRLGRVIQKIKDFIDALINLHHRTARGVFRDIESGKIFDKTTGVNEFSQSPAFSLSKAIKSILDNPAFVKWFGDSKVVDEKGEPLVVYHGTDQDFESFDPKKIGTTFGVDTKGFFFTDALPEAKYTARYAADGSGRERILSTYLSIKNPYRHTTKDTASTYFDNRTVEILKAAEDAGNDGIIINGYRGNLYIVFNPTQIKSIYNRGAFDPSDPRIQYTYAGGRAKTADVPAKVGAGEQYSTKIEGPVTFTETAEPVTNADFRDNRASQKNLKQSAIAEIKDVARSAVAGVGRVLSPISTRMERINPKLKTRVRRLDFDIATGIQRRIAAVLPSLKKSKKMSKDDATDWNYAQQNSAAEKLDQLIDEYDMREEYTAKREMLNQLRNDGIDVGLDIGFIPNYAPRKVKNYLGLLGEMGREQKDIYTKAIQERAQLMGITETEMDADMKANIIINILMGHPVGTGGVSATEERKFVKIPPRLMKYYYSSDAALMMYITEMVTAIESRKFFGKLPEKVKLMRTEMYKAQAKIRKIRKQLKEAAGAEIGRLEKKFDKWDGVEKQHRALLDKYAAQRDYTDNIGAYINELRESGDIQPEQMDVVHGILKAYFHDRGTKGIVGLYKNFSLIDTMGSVISAITQFGDQAWTVYRFGLPQAVKHGFKAVPPKKYKKIAITREDVGQERIGQEFADPATMGAAVSWVFKATGLEKIDAIGKESLLNAAHERYTKIAKENPKALLEEILPRMRNRSEAEGVIIDLANDDMTDDVRFLAYSNLADFQPIAKSEMPQKYLEMENGKIFYMLKTFTIKQFDVFRNEAFHKIRTGNKQEKARGLRNLIKLSAVFILANAGADELKDWMLGRKTDFEDRVWDNILRLVGVSKYVTWKARTEGVGSALARQVLPPFKFVDALGKDIINAGDEKGLETLSSLPLAGKLLYWWVGRGTKKREDLWDRRLRKYKARLRNIKEDFDKSKDRAAFREKHRSDLFKYRRVTGFQGKLNKTRKRINILKSRKETPSTTRRIQQLEKRRTEQIKHFLKKG